MNQRIKELLPNPFAVDYQYKDGPLDLYTEKEMEKLAELIVQECITVLDEDDGATHHTELLKEHFGVEE
jgi:hypothetical protein